jgi:hypothetical protein
MYRTKKTINKKSLENGNTQLINAAIYNAKEMARQSIEWGADINAQNNIGDTALIEACRKGHYDIVVMLLKCGASLGIKNNFGQNAIMETPKSGNVNIFALLIEAGADVREPNIMVVAKVYNQLAIENYLSRYLFAVETLAADLESRFIYHDGGLKFKCSFASLVVRYDYLLGQCQKIGVLDPSALLNLADTYLQEQGVVLIG